MISAIDSISSITGTQELKTGINKEEQSNLKSKSSENNLEQQSNASSSKNEKPYSFDKENIQADFKDLEEKLKPFFDEENQTVEFSMDDVTNRLVMKVIDNKTKEVIKQYPPEITLKIARIIANTLEQGKVTNARV